MPVGTVTGSYNKYITILAFLLMFLYYLLLDKSQLSFRSILYFWTTFLGISISQLFLQGDMQEVFRYISLIMISILAGQSKMFDLSFFCRIIIVISFIFSVLNMIEGLDRFPGFLMSSPTLFSYCVLIALTYLVFTPKKIIDYLLIFIGVWMIYKTDSRSTLFVLMLFVLIYFLSKMPKNKYLLFFKFLLSIVVIFFLFFIAKGIWDGSIIIREDSFDSTMTRLKFIYTGIDYLNSNPIHYIIGFGPGASYDLISQLSGTHIPLHFDLLSILIDFGILGLLMMILFPLFISKNWSWQGWVLLLLGNIHNLLLFPIGLVLVILISRQLGQERKGVYVSLNSRHTK